MYSWTEDQLFQAFVASRELEVLVSPPNLWKKCLIFEMNKRVVAPHKHVDVEIYVKLLDVADPFINTTVTMIGLQEISERLRSLGERQNVMVVKYKDVADQDVDWSLIGDTQKAVDAYNPLMKEIENIIVQGDEPRQRKNVHMSDILSKNFCYRKCTFAACDYPQDQIIFKPDRIKTNAQGWDLHRRWQAWAARAGVSLGAEIERKVPHWFLAFTPDDVWKLKTDNIVRVVEYKGYDHQEVYKSLKVDKPPRDALIQVNCYCYLLNIPDWLILVESKGKILDEAESKKQTEANNKFSPVWRKGTQEVCIWTGKFDPELVKPYVVKLNTLKIMVEEHLKSGRLHPGICVGPQDYTAKECPFHSVCFMSPRDRQLIQIEKRNEM